MKMRKSKVLFPLGLFISLLALLIMNFGTPISAVAGNIKLKEGTPVILKLAESVSSEVANVGDPVNLSIARDVEVEGKVVISEGTRARGEVVSVEKTGYIGKPGKIMIAARNTTAVDGTEVPLRDTVTREGKSKQTTALVLGLVVCTFLLFMKGESAEVPAGTEIKAYVDYSLDIKI